MGKMKEMELSVCDMSRAYVKPSCLAIWIGGSEELAQNIDIPVGSNADPEGPVLVKDELDDEYGGTELPKAPNLWDNVW